jgi:hypothetical protein
MEHSHLGVPKMKQKRHIYKFNKTIGISYLYTKETSELTKQVLEENCLDAIRKRLRWLHDLTDTQLISHLEISDKRYREPKKEKKF